AIPVPITDLAALLTRVPDRPLGERGVGPELARASTERDFPLGAGVLTARAASGVSLFAFNSPDDADADGVLRPGGAAGTLPPPLSLDPGRAWIKTRFELSAGVAGGGSADDLGFELGSEGKILLADYRVFGREESARAAVASALAG